MSCRRAYTVRNDIAFAAGTYQPASADARQLIAHELAHVLQQREGSLPRVQRQFDLAGGDIRNVALEAALLAADDGGVIGMRPIVHALARQLAKLGKTPTGSDFHQYQCLLG